MRASSGCRCTNLQLDCVNKRIVFCFVVEGGCILQARCCSKSGLLAAEESRSYHKGCASNSSAADSDHRATGKGSLSQKARSPKGSGVLWYDVLHRRMHTVSVALFSVLLFLCLCRCRCRCLCMCMCLCLCLYLWL